MSTVVSYLTGREMDRIIKTRSNFIAKYHVAPEAVESTIHDLFETSPDVAFWRVTEWTTYTRERAYELRRIWRKRLKRALVAERPDARIIGLGIMGYAIQ